MKSLCYWLSALFVGTSSLIMAAYADAIGTSPKILEIDFAAKNPKDYVLTQSFAAPAENPEKKGAMLLKIDTRQSDAPWNACFKTVPGMLKPGMDYIVQAKCEVLEADADSYLFPMIRPYGANNAYSDIAHGLNAHVGAWERIHLRFHVPEHIRDYSFQIHTSKKVLALVDDITISECASEKQVSLGENFPPDELAGQLPAGADNFVVEFPRPSGGQIESVAQYGADVNSPDNSKAFNDAIIHCATTKASKLIVPKGTYRFTADAPLHFEKLTDFEFDGQGSTFVFLKKKNDLVQILKSERILLKNFSIDWDWEKDPLASVVRAEAVEPSGAYADFRFIDYQKFPKQDIRIATLEQLDPKTLSPGCENYAGIFLDVFPGRTQAPKFEWLEDNLLRIYSRSGGSWKSIVPGTLFRMKHYYYDMPGISMKDNVNLTLSRVNIYSAPGMGLLVSGEQHHWQFLNTNIVRPPATTRPITCTADQYHVNQSCGYFRMEGCEFSLGGDDAINIHDCSGFGYKTGESTLTTTNLSEAASYHVGDSIEFRRDDYVPAEFTSRIQSIIPVDPKRRIYEFTFENPIPETTSGFILFNRRYGSQQIVIRNCYFHDCSRILLLANNVTFEKNRIVHSTSTALKIEAGYTLNVWSEGYGASNVVIRDNVFDNVNLIGRYPNERQPVIYMSVYLKTDPSSERTTYPILGNILIEGNTFHTFPGAVAYICSAQNVFIQKNTISDETPRQQNFPYKGSIVAAYASNVFVTGNTWNESQYMQAPSLIFDPETSREIHSWDNNLMPSTR